jgi:PAS domain S-box-containing protein
MTNTKTTPKEITDQLAALRRQLAAYQKKEQQWHRTEAALHLSLEERQRLYDTTPAMLMATDGDGLIVNVSEAWLRTMGYERKEVLGRNYSEFLTETSRRTGEETAWPSLYSTGSLTAVPFQMVNKNGELLEVLFSATAELDQTGRPIGSRVFMENTTARTKAADHLNRNRKLLQDLLDHGPALIHLKDTQGRYLMVNQGYEKVYQVKREDIVGRTDREVFPNQQAETALGQDQIVMATGTGLEIVEQVAGEDGTASYMTMKFPLKTEDGVIYAICGISADITRRVEIEEALRESESKHRTLVENIQDGVFIVQDNLFKFVNEAFAAMLGYRVDQVVGLDFRQLVAPEYLDMVADRYRRRQAGEDVPGEYEFRVIHRDGSLRTVNMNMGLFSYQGRLAGLGTIKDITERKRVEEEIARSEKTLKTILDSMPFGVMMVGSNGIIRHANQAALKLLGYDREEELMGQPCRRTLCLADHDLCPVLDHGLDINTVECELRTRNGHRIPILKSVVSINLEGEHILLEAFIDVLERQKAEQALRASEAKFRAIIENMPDIYYRADLKGQLLLANIEGARILGYGAVEELIGLNLAEAFYANPQERNSLVKALQEKGYVKNFAVTLKRKDGGLIRVEVNSHFVLDESGRPMAVEGIARDVTARIKAEQELAASRERYRFLLENAPVGIGSINEQGVIEDANPRLLALLGLGRDGLAEPINSLTYPPLVRDGVSDDIKHCLQYSEAVVSEKRYLTESGQHFYLRYHLNPVDNAIGSKSGALAIVEDVTEEKRLRKESEYRLQQIIQADKLASLGEVVAGVAHEINNPNSFIAYNIPLLEETWTIFAPLLRAYFQNNPSAIKGHPSFEELIGDMNDIIEAIKTGSSRINSVVSSLKDYVRFDDGLERKDVRINEVIKKALVIVGAQIRKAVSQLDLELTPELPVVKGHFQKLEQVVTNLLVNAGNSITAKEKGRIGIRTRYIDRLKCIIIEVEDNGQGMDTRTMNHIFEPFFTSHRESGGTGLGLSVSLKLIQEHGGRIGVCSHKGLGSRFTVFLPLDPNCKLDLTPAILCVDDDPQFLKVLGAYFSTVYQKPFEVSASPQQVLTYLADHPEVDIVLSDVVMPELSGWTLLEQIKARHPLTRVILYSGFSLDTSREMAVKPDYYFKKPFDLKRMLDLINSLERQRL